MTRTAGVDPEGVSHDNVGGVSGETIDGHLIVKNYIAPVQEIYVTPGGGAIPSAAQTPIGALTGQGVGSLAFGHYLGSLSFSVPVSGGYKHGFSIPITAGGTGGDIEVRALQDGGIIESWLFTVAATAKTVLQGFQFDLFDIANVCQYALFHSNGSGWSMSGQAVLDIELKA